MEHFIIDLGALLLTAAVLSCIAALFNQPIIIAYILAGILMGPWGLKYVENVAFIEIVSSLGVTLLLFLAGLCLDPQKLLKLFKSTSFVTLIHCGLSFIVGFIGGVMFGFTSIESLCIGFALMFSSTILVIKLLPTTRLHHERMGAICIGVTIIQDLLAMGVLAFIKSMGGEGVFSNFGILSLKLFLLILALIIFEQFVLTKVMAYIDRLQEVLFLLGLAWCFGIAALAHQIGLFYETGAFFAGVVLARHKVSLFIYEKLKPIRDFFLVLFFFTLGAKLDLSLINTIIWPTLALTAAVMAFKPVLFKWLFVMTGEKAPFSQEMGVRLGQMSEFSLLIAISAQTLGHISVAASQLIQLVTIFTFILSSYFVVYNYQTPIGTSESLTRD